MAGGGEQRTSRTALHGLARIGAAGLILYAIAKHPYWYYTFVRWVVFAVCCWGLWLCRRRYNSFVFGYIIIGLIFNPLVPFQFDRSTWQILDVVTGLLLLASLALHRPDVLDDDDHRQ